MSARPVLLLWLILIAFALPTDREQACATGAVYEEQDQAKTWQVCLPDRHWHRIHNPYVTAATLSKPQQPQLQGEQP